MSKRYKSKGVSHLESYKKLVYMIGFITIRANLKQLEKQRYPFYIRGLQKQSLQTKKFGSSL